MKILDLSRDFLFEITSILSTDDLLEAQEKSEAVFIDDKIKDSKLTSVPELPITPAFLTLLKLESLTKTSEKSEATKYPHLHSKKIEPVCSTKP